MSRILVLGLGPLPFENERRLYGPGIRTWQLARPLAADGHEVLLVTARIRGAYAKARGERRESHAGVTRLIVDEERFWDAGYLQRIHDDFAAEAVVGATAYGSSAASGLRGGRPLWADLFGDLLAEAQAKAAAYDDDYYVVHFWNVLRPVLDRADVFSSVSDRQGYAVLGALGLRGRLNKSSSGHAFVHTIACGADPLPRNGAAPVLRARDAGEKDFLVLWSGGYNTWADVETLFAGVERAMEQEPRLRFVSTGGQIDHHDEKTYPRLLGLVARSRFRDRFLMKGWLPTAEVAGHYFECDVGVHSELPLAERVLGSQNRVVGWMMAGLPVVCSDLSELGRTIERERLGLTFTPGDARGLAEALLRLARDQGVRREHAERARAYALAHLTFEETTRPLRAWAARPTCAPDRGRRVRLEEFEAAPAEERPLTHYLLTARLQGFTRANLRALRHLGRRLRRLLPT